MLPQKLLAIGAIRVLFAVVGLAVAIGTVCLVHRMLVALEEKGYIYYRQKREGKAGGIPGAALEADRLLARPSMQHVVEAQDPIVRQDDIAGQ